MAGLQRRTYRSIQQAAVAATD